MQILRKWRWLAGAGAVVIGVTVTGPGCAWQVRQSELPVDPQTIYLVEHGRHTRVAVPLDRDHLVEYGFGEWRFYGLEDRSTASALRAALGFGTPARSRRVMDAVESGEEFARKSGGTRWVALDAERAKVSDFVARMEAEWKPLKAHTIVRKRDGVPVARVASPPYHLFKNSNHFTADNLRSLGFDVSGFPILSNFRVVDTLREAEAASSADPDG